MAKSKRNTALSQPAPGNAIASESAHDALPSPEDAQAMAQLDRRVLPVLPGTSRARHAGRHPWSAQCAAWC